MTDTPTISTADSLRALADHLDRHPGLDPTTVPTFYVYAENTETFAGLVRKLGGTITNPVTKTADDYHLGAFRMFGRVRLEVFMPRSTACERVQVGTRTVERPIMQQVGTETVEEAVYEWECAPILSTTPEPLPASVAALEAELLADDAPAPAWSHEAELAQRAADELDARRAERAEDRDDAYSATGQW